MIVGYASGAFDLFHVGHLNLLRHAKLQCDQLLVGVVTDDVYLDIRGYRPYVPFEERLAIVRSVSLVDAAVGDPFNDKAESWRIYQFDLLIKGDDWLKNPKNQLLTGRLRELGVEVAYVPYTEHTSSSHLKQRLAERQQQFRDAGPTQ